MNAELDRRIAKLVMGWTPSREPRLRASDGTHYIDRANNHRWWADDFGPQSKLWSPSSIPEDAMTVLKKCIEKRQSGAISIDLSCSVWGVWSGPFSAGEKTLELAICQFAVKLFNQ